MGMENTYKREILEEALMEFLENNTIPTADQLIEAYEDLVGTRDMTKPFLSDSEYSVDEWTDSSASYFNSFFTRSQKDIRALYREVWDRSLDAGQSANRWREELNRLESQLIDLESRIDNLLLLRQDTDGYFAWVEDNFVDMSKVDQANTTAEVNINAHTVTFSEDTTTQDFINLNEVEAQEATFRMLTTSPYIAGASNVPGVTPAMALADANSFWQYRVRATQPISELTGEFWINIASENVEISRIELKLHSSNTNSPMLITGQYSTDNYSWFNLPTESYVQSTDTKAVFRFLPTEMKYIKFIMTKVGYDHMSDSLYVYEFGLSEVNLFMAGFNITDGSILQSLPLQAMDDDDNAVIFNKLALQSCQETPDMTSVDYYLKASNDTTDTGWLRIDPYNVSDPRAVTQLDLGKITRTEETGLVKVTKGQAESSDYFGQYSEIVATDNFALLGTGLTAAYKLPMSIYQDMVDDQVFLYRNVGPRFGITSETDTVRDAPRGWRFDGDGTFLVTHFVINNPLGIYIDFGSAGAYLDGELVVGGKQISSGLHEFKTHISNTGFVSGTYYNVEELKAADKQLYPYNHRKLIEGYDYPVDFEGDQVYTGMDLFCSYRCRLVGVFDLLYNTEETDFSRFSADLVDISGTTYRVFLVRFDPAASDHASETFAITYGVANNLYDTVTLKAELKSDDENITPTISAYRVKLGV